MAKLSSSQESFIQMMRTDEESAREGFGLLATYPDFDLFFDELAAVGFFSPTENPIIVGTPEAGYMVPYWAALDYLVAAAKFSKEKQDTKLAEKVMNVVRAVSTYKEED